MISKHCVVASRHPVQRCDSLRHWATNHSWPRPLHGGRTHQGHGHACAAHALTTLFGATTNALMQFTELPGYLEARAVEGPVHVFDRTQPFGHRDKLDYRVVVNWVIAAHRSQGTMQLAMNKGDRERFFVLDTGTEGAQKKTAAWFEALKEPQFPKKVYGASAGTNASSN